MKRRLIVLLLTTLLISACRKGNPEPPATSTGAPLSRRPSAPLGMYVSYYLGDTTILPTTSAIKGVQAQIRLHQPLDPITLDDTFELLQAFGNALQVDINDLLNRSADRPQTLSDYTTALTNITARSRRKAEDLDRSLTELRRREREQRQVVSGLERSISKALRDRDFALAGSLQADLSNAQTTLAATENTARQTRSALDAYNELIKIAESRKAAIDQNREILIAGLKIVDMPGIENLGIVERARRR